jgi:hypothetical protein
MFKTDIFHIMWAHEMIPIIANSINKGQCRTQDDTTAASQQGHFTVTVLLKSHLIDWFGLVYAA